MSYTCDDGYYYEVYDYDEGNADDSGGDSGVYNITCGVDGQWDKAVPYCEGRRDGDGERLDG